MSESLKKSHKPLILVPEDALKEAGFTETGREEFKNLTSAFCDRLFELSIYYGGNVVRGKREVTYEHVKQAASKVYNYPIEKASSWSTGLQVIEYLATGFVGVGASNFSENWGKVFFFLSLAIGIIAFVTRKFTRK